MALTFDEYLAAFPGAVARHMIRAAGESATIASGFLEAVELLGWPQYAGGFLHWQIMDVRLYKTPGWDECADAPFRVYISDYDDWNIERMFETRAEAEEAVALLATGPVDLEGLRALGFATT